MNGKKNSARLLKVSYYGFLLLLFTTPLIFLTQIENVFSLAKKSSLIVFGGIFIILSTAYLLERIYEGTHSGVVFLDKKIDPVVFLFIASAFLSTIFSIKPYVSYYGQYERQIGFIVYLYLLCVYFLSSQLFRNKTDGILRIMGVTGAAVAIYAVIQYSNLDPFQTPLIGGTRPVSTLGHSTFAAGFMVVVLPFAVMRIFSGGRPYVGVISSLLISAGLIVTQTRAAYIAATVSIMLMLLLYPFIYRSTDNLKFRKLMKFNLIILAATIIVAVLLILLFPENKFIAKLQHTADLPGSARWFLWRDSLQAYKVHPFFGSGIATFASVFDYFGSYQLKELEPRNYFDNAHNVVINTLVTMGAIGTAAYVILMFQGFRVSVKVFFNKSPDLTSKFFFLAVLVSLAGFTIYSLADFEDISILLYVFLIFSLLKSKSSSDNGSAFLLKSTKAKNAVIYGGAFSAIIISFYCMYNFYSIYTELKADAHFRDAKILYSSGDFSSSVRELNEAVIKNPGSGEYRFTLASYVSGFCLRSLGLKTETKVNLLNQAEQELERAKDNYQSYLQYKALLCIINYQLGNTETAEKLKAEVFKTDSLLLNFRNNLASFYFGTGDSLSMTNNLNAVFSVDKYNSEATIILASYYASKGKKAEAFKVCSNYLEKYPLDPFLLQLREKIKTLPDK